MFDQRFAHSNSNSLKALECEIHLQLWIVTFDLHYIRIFLHKFCKSSSWLGKFNSGNRWHPSFLFVSSLSDLLSLHIDKVWYLHAISSCYNNYALLLYRLPYSFDIGLLVHLCTLDGLHSGYWLERLLERCSNLHVWECLSENSIPVCFGLCFLLLASDWSNLLLVSKTQPRRVHESLEYLSL